MCHRRCGCSNCCSSCGCDRGRDCNDGPNGVGVFFTILFVLVFAMLLTSCAEPEGDHRATLSFDERKELA